MRPSRLLRSAIVLKPATIMAFHRALVKRKYRLLFTPRQHRKPGPKGPARELITAIVEMKHRNPRFGCRRIAQQLAFMFGVEIDKDVVRRVLARRYRPEPDSQGPSWLTFLGHSKDGLWSVDLFRCESIDLDPIPRGSAVQHVDRAGIRNGADILVRHTDGEVGDSVARAGRACYTAMA